MYCSSLQRACVETHCRLLYKFAYPVQTVFELQRLSLYIYIYAYNNFPKFTGLGCHTQEDLSILALGSRLYIIDPVWPQCMNQSVSPGFYLINIADSSAQILLEKQARNILCASLNVPRQATQNVSLVPYAILMQTIHKHLAHRM